MDDGTNFVWVQDRRTHQLLELYYVPRGSPLYKPFRSRGGFEPVLTFGIRDAEPLLRRLRRFGVKVSADFPVGHYRLTLVHDTDGTGIELLSWSKESMKTHRDPPLLSLVLGTRRPMAN